MFKNMKIKTRLTLLVSFMSLVLIIVGILGLQGIKISQTGIQNVYSGGVDSIEELNGLSNHLDFNVFNSTQKISDGKLSWSEGIAKINEAINGIPMRWEAYLKTEINPTQQKMADHLHTSLIKITASLEQLLGIMKRQNKEEFSTYVSNELYPLLESANREINDLIKMHIDFTKIDYDNGIANSQLMVSISIISIICAILISILFAIFIIRSIIIPLDATIDAINRVALGDTSIQLTISSKNELGQLMSSLQNMIDATQKMIIILAKVSHGDLTGNVQMRSSNDLLGKAINDMIDRLKHMISEVQEEVTVLSSSTEEIVSSIAQVTTGTAETAAAVTETTTTMEELKQTAQVSAEKAQDVLSNAETTLKVVKSSEQSVSATIDDMNQIQEKMRIISESIIKLSEHSLAIGEIIGAVNDLAEQSNLLAVNAAIEAAKAGDQGKSFGVVAQEIRILAEQSKSATVQIRVILNDIQNATSATVIATEQGSKAVMKGVGQSSQTNSAMQSLSTSISKSAQAAKQIAISSQQQLVGIEQVTTAMSDINQASNQHVEHMKQIEQAIASVNEVGGTLKILTNQYVLNIESMPDRSMYKKTFSDANKGDRSQPMKGSKQKEAAHEPSFAHSIDHN